MRQNPIAPCKGGVLPGAGFLFLVPFFSGKYQPLDSFWIESNNIIKKIDFSEQSINFEKATDNNSAGIICLKSRPQWNLEKYLDSWIDFNLFKKNHNKALYLSNLLKEFGLWKPEHLKRHSLIQALSKYGNNTFDQNWLNIVKAFQSWPEVPETFLKKWILEERRNRGMAFDHSKEYLRTLTIPPTKQVRAYG